LAPRWIERFASLGVYVHEDGTVRFLAIPGALGTAFLTLSYFSRLCIFSLLASRIWSVKTFSRLLVMIRTGESGAAAEATCPQLLSMNNIFHGFFRRSEIVPGSCFSDQMFAFFDTSLERSTDANPFPVLILASGIGQFVVGVLMLIHSRHPYVSSLLHGKHAELPHQSCEKD
jgi:hypothetical protein